MQISFWRGGLYPRSPRIDRMPIKAGPTATSSGIDIATTTWGGQGPPVLLVHATGFCAGIWGCIAEGLTAHHRVLAYDQRGHGDSAKPDDPDAYEWERYADDCLAVIEALDLGPISAAGHSSGAATLVLAATRAPELFDRLVLVEPIIFPPVPPGTDTSSSNLLAEGARRRRMVFDSRDEMRERFAAKPPMADWDPRVLDDYVAHGSFVRADGKVELKCPGKIESWMYEGGAHHRGYEALCEVGAETLLLGSDSADSPMPIEYWRHLSERLPHGHFEALEGLGHFAPMQDPDRLCGRIARFINLVV